jgi:hypothetical protein
MDDADPQSHSRRRLQTVFGWVAGGSLGVLASYGVYMLVGDAYPKEPAIVVLFALGAYGGMRVSDRLGPRGFRPLGIAAGVLATLFVVLALLVLLGPQR